MLSNRVFYLCLLPLALSGCTTKMAIKGYTSDNSTWVGYSIPYSEFKMSNGSIECTGKSTDVWSDFTIRYDFTCSDGRSGVIKEDKAISGKATANFSDGTEGKFYWGMGMQ